MTNLKAVESTISTPETSNRCELTSMIEPSVSRILGNVALALELRRLTLSPFCAAEAAAEASWPSRSSDPPAVWAPRSSQREDADDGCGGRAGLCRAGRRWLGSGSGRANGVLASVLAALLCCTVVCVTCVCIHEIERSLNFNLYNTDYLWVPRASRAPTRGCSPARFLHCAIAPQGASAP